jgi:oligoribonuclease NrnB/cAMP/cGMP phosphodiesterase (DHH superfamily)
MINYPFTFDDKIEMVLNGIFMEDAMRKEIRSKIADEVREYIKANKLTTDITTISNAVSYVLYQKIVK